MEFPPPPFRYSYHLLLITINCPRSILFLMTRMMDGLIRFLVGGKSNAKPMASVIKPGVSNTTPPIKIQRPSIMTSPGICPLFIFCCALLSAEIPWYFASQAPKTPVRMINRIVGIAPISFPAVIRIQISNAGTTIINANKILNIRGQPHFFKTKLPINYIKNTRITLI